MLRIPLKAIDVEIAVGTQVNLKRWALSISLLEINVSSPPRRKLDDIRFTCRVGPISFGLIFAHYRGEAQTYNL